MLLAESTFTLIVEHVCKRSSVVPVDVTSNSGSVQKLNVTEGTAVLENPSTRHKAVLLEAPMSVDLILVDHRIVQYARLYLYLIPVRHLGTEYYVIFPKHTGIDSFVIGITGLAHSSTVQIWVKHVDDCTHTDSILINIAPLEAFVVSKPFDVSGSRALSDQSIFVSCMFIIKNTTGIMPSLPVKMLGTRFLLPTFPPLLKSEFDANIRIVIVANATFVEQSNVPLNNECRSRGRVIDVYRRSIKWSDKVFFHANKPLLVLRNVVTFNTILAFDPLETYTDYWLSTVGFIDPRQIYCALSYLGYGKEFPLTVNISFVNTAMSEVLTAEVVPHSAVRSENFTTTAPSLDKAVAGTVLINIKSSHPFAGTCVIITSNHSIMMYRKRPLEPLYQVIPHAS